MQTGGAIQTYEGMWYIARGGSLRLFPLPPLTVQTEQQAQTNTLAYDIVPKAVSSIAGAPLKHKLCEDCKGALQASLTFHLLLTRIIMSM